MSEPRTNFELNRKRGAGRPSALRLQAAVVLLVASFVPASALPAEVWRLAKGPSSVEFTIGHLVFSEVEGRFGRFQGTVDCPGDDFTDAQVQVSIDVASIYTGHTDRDRELLGEDFFAADRFPEMRFESRSVVPTGPETYRLSGELTLRGVTREVDLEARSSGRFATAAGERLDFRATGSIRRSDFGITWNDTWAGRLILADEVDIRLDVALVPTS